MLGSEGHTVLLSSSWECQAPRDSARRGFVAGICAQGTRQRRRRISKQCCELSTNWGNGTSWTSVPEAWINKNNLCALWRRNELLGTGTIL